MAAIQRNDAGKANCRTRRNFVDQLLNFVK